MNLASAKTALKRYGFDDGDPLETWLNAAMHELENYTNWPFLNVRVLFTMLAGDADGFIDTSLLPTSLIKVYSLKDLTHGGQKLRQLSNLEFEGLISLPTATGKAQYYRIVGSSVQVYPIPDEDSQFSLIYRRVIDDLSSSQTVIGLPVAFHYPMILRAASIALMAENEEDRAQTAQTQFQMAVDSLMTAFASTDGDEASAVVDVMGYGEGAYGYGS